MSWFLVGLAVAATPTEIDGAISAYNRHAVFEIPVLDPAQVQDLLEGQVVRILFHASDPDAPSAAVAMVLSEVPRNALWIAAQDPHTQVDAGLSEQLVRSLGDDHAIWYGYWDLPKPVRDRQWVVASRNTHALAAATDGLAWEHSWALVEDGLTEVRDLIPAAQLDGAIFTPVNRGAWFMLELEDGKTLLGYQATSVVGGAIPTWLVTQLVMSRLESILVDLQTRARTWSPTHYVGSHAPVFGGDGEAIPRF